MNHQNTINSCRCMHTISIRWHGVWCSVRQFRYGSTSSTWYSTIFTLWLWVWSCISPPPLWYIAICRYSKRYGSMCIRRYWKCCYWHSMRRWRLNSKTLPPIYLVRSRIWAAFSSTIHCCAIILCTSTSSYTPIKLQQCESWLTANFNWRVMQILAWCLPTLIRWDAHAFLIA